MYEGSTTPEALLREAGRLAAAGKKNEARELIAEALRLDDKSISAWALLAKFANSTTEEIFCLKRVVHLDPWQTWANQRLQELAASQPTAPFVRSTASPQAAVKPVTPAEQRRRRTDPALIFFWAALLIFGVTCALTAISLTRPQQQIAPVASQPYLMSSTSTQVELAVASDDRCQRLIENALQASDQGCTRMAPNQVCYGNTTVSAQLAPGAPSRFEQRGDIVNVDSLLGISVSPLDPAKDEWGIAVFKLLANLPRTLPGQNVTFIVFGNTSLTNASGNMQAFYFSSALGQIACEGVPFDGILIHMPDGAGLSFSANGSDLTLLGIASLQATANERMAVSLLHGGASITADGQTQFFGAGQKVEVPLGGENGLDPAGPPSAPIDTSPDSLTVSCTLLNTNCDPAELQPVDAADAQLAISQALSTSTPTATFTRGPTPTRTKTATPGPSSTPSDTATVGPSPTPSNTDTPTDTATATASPTSSLTPSAPPSPTITLTPSTTATPSNTPTDTPSPTPTWTSSPPPPVLAFGNFVVLGQEGVWVESNGIIRSGDIGANNSGSGPYLSDNEEVVIGQNVAFSDSTSRVLGDSVNLKDGVQAPYVYYNNITGSGTALNPYTPLALPLLPDFPAVPSFTPGTQNLVVFQNGTLTLDAGDYGDLIAHNNSTVTFNGGIYTFTKWDVWQRVRIYFAAPTEIRIADKMDTDQNTFVGPAPSASGLTARDIRIIVMGINGGSGTVGASPKAGEIGTSNTVIANVYVPNGTLWIRSNTNATGAFIARWVHIAQSVELFLESGF